MQFIKQPIGYFFRNEYHMLWFQSIEEEFAKFVTIYARQGTAKLSVALPHHRMVLDLRGIMETIILECVDRVLAVRRKKDEFQPHLSLGQFMASRVKAICKKAWVDFSFEVKNVHLIGYRSHTVAVYLLVWASYKIRKIAGSACAGNAGNVFPASDPHMHAMMHAGIAK